MTKRILVLLLLLSVSAVHAEMRRLTEGDFETNVQKYAPGLASGADASSVFARHGVFLSSYPAGTPVVDGWVAPPPDPPRIDHVVVNKSNGNQADSVLVVDFRSPVSKVGLLLVGPSGVEVSIKAGGQIGNILGSLTDTVKPKGSFIGFEVSDNEPISKVIIDFRSERTPERLMALTVERPSSPRFETVIPQIAHKQLRSDLLFSTSITIVNVSDTTATGQIRFYASEGYPLAPELQGAAGQDYVVPFSLDQSHSRLLTTSGTSGIAGYARVVSNAPLQTIAHFSLTGSTGDRREVAMTSVRGQFGAVGAYNEQYVSASESIGPVTAALSPEAPKVDTALAIVNLASEPAVVRLRLVDERDMQRTNVVILGPGKQFARFIDEIFEPGFAPRGTIRILSDQPVAPILIKTVNGLPDSILPLGSLED